jgi:hypothetical protein
MVKGVIDMMSAQRAVEEINEYHVKVVFVCDALQTHALW